MALVQTPSRSRVFTLLSARWSRWRRWARQHTLILDAVLSAMVLGPILIGEVVGALPVTKPIATAVILATTVIAMVALAFRRVRADASGVAIAACGYLGIAVVTHTPVLALMFAAVIGTYSMAAYGSRLGSWMALPLTIFGAVIFALRYYSAAPDGVEKASYTVAGAIMMGCASAGLWGLGMWRRIRRREIDGLRERARLLEAERAQEAQLAAAGERTRIAREMHDIIAHSLTVVIAQADGGRYAAAADPDAAQQALSTISRTGRNALADMRSLLGVLRDEDSVREASVLPTIADIDDLVATMRTGGLRVTYQQLGEPASIGIGGELTVYRVVQESLTNVIKHSGPTSAAQVQLHWQADVLTIVVSNDARGPQDRMDDAYGGTGKGILGMRERLALHGGTLQTGSSGAGFEVVATLPIDRSAIATQESRK